MSAGVEASEHLFREIAGSAELRDEGRGARCGDCVRSVLGAWTSSVRKGVTTWNIVTGVLWFEYPPLVGGGVSLRLRVGR